MKSLARWIMLVLVAALALQVFFIAQPLNLTLGLALFASVLGAMLTAFAAAMAAWLRAGWI